ncbi:hypothetical protein OSH39_25290, partial [Mycobacterium ulcerans]|nr:hypothetical protein [Mycobacterium ulcerans]MEB3911384.1 hypothetical protein [Mycobacterium ulcerans]MEB3921621.1 hypothetical protein [Mycobacterium ulcerans]MEB3925754.1 hypothetical protein [Mycobacterium ulcerans]MEB3929881.1 hypothetical protein [Mycobacterium ulcerans]
MPRVSDYRLNQGLLPLSRGCGVPGLAMLCYPTDSAGVATTAWVAGHRELVHANESRSSVGHRRGVLTLDQQPIRGHQLARNPFRAV